MKMTNSPAPGTPQTGTKAYVAAALAFAAIVLTQWISDDGGVTGKELASWILMGIVGSGLTGGVTYTTKNKAL